MTDIYGTIRIVKIEMCQIRTDHPAAAFHEGAGPVFSAKPLLNNKSIRRYQAAGEHIVPDDCATAFSGKVFTDLQKQPALEGIL